MAIYPLRDGLPVPPYELQLRHSQLDLSIRRNLNNHHNLFVSSIIARTALGQVAKDLARHQTVMPIDTHAYLHGMYEAPYGSSRDVTPMVVYGLMNAVDEAYHNGELLKYGSALTPKYAQITRTIYDRCVEDYTRLR